MNWLEIYPGDTPVLRSVRVLRTEQTSYIASFWPAGCKPVILNDLELVGVLRGTNGLCSDFESMAASIKALEETIQQLQADAKK